MKHQQDGNTEEQFRNPVTTIYATTACAIMVQKMASARGHVNGSPDVYTWKETIEMADEEKKEKVRFDWTDVGLSGHLSVFAGFCGDYPGALPAVVPLGRLRMGSAPDCCCGSRSFVLL